MMQLIGVAHALWLHHIDLLRKIPIEKGIIDIKLANASLNVEGNAKHSTDNDQIYHEIENLLKISVRLLVETLSNKASFILCDRAVGILFNAKHPFYAHYILPQARGN